MLALTLLSHAQLWTAVSLLNHLVRVCPACCHQCCVCLHSHLLCMASSDLDCPMRKAITVFHSDCHKCKDCLGVSVLDPYLRRFSVACRWKPPPPYTHAYTVNGSVANWPPKSWICPPKHLWRVAPPSSPTKSSQMKLKKTHLSVSFIRSNESPYLFH